LRKGFHGEKEKEKGSKEEDGTETSKIIDGKPVVSDTLANEQTGAVSALRKDVPARLLRWRMTSREDWPKLAATAIRTDHDLRHEVATIPLEWRGARRR